jgi:RNA recognition motif-containing protein
MTGQRIAGYSPRLAKVNIYVGNLSLIVTEAELRQAFTAFGQVVSVNLMNDGYIGSRQSRVYAFVEMALKSEGEAAVKGLDGQTLGGQAISVQEALPLSPHPSGPPNHNKFRHRS